MNKIDEKIIQEIIDHLLYLSNDDKKLYIEELNKINHHFIYKNKVNYDISTFKIDLKHAI